MVEFRQPPATSGSAVSTEIAASLRDRHAAYPDQEVEWWGLVEEHPLPVAAGNPDIETVRDALSDADFPATAGGLSKDVQDRQATALLTAVARSDAKVAAKASEAVREFTSLDQVLKAVLALLKTRVRARASSRTGVIKDGRVKAFSPPGVFESRSTTENGVVCVYARYLGDEHARPAKPVEPKERPPAFPQPTGDNSEAASGTADHLNEEDVARLLS